MSCCRWPDWRVGRVPNWDHDAATVFDMTPVFIVGEQRSGSNLLRLMLNQLPEVCAPHPPHILQHLMPIWLQVEPEQDSDSCARIFWEAVCELVECNPIPWNIAPIDRDQGLGRVAGSAHPLLDAFDRAMTLEAETTGARIWVNKSMQDIRWQSEIDVHFRQRPPRYLYLHRDPREVCASFQKAIVGEKHAYSIARRWACLQDLCLATEAANPDRFHRVAYRDLVEDPDHSMRGVCHFLGTDYDPAILSFHESTDARTTANAGRIWQRVDKPITTERLSRYPDELAIEDQKIVERVAVETMNQLGYLREVDPRPTYREKISPAQIEEYEALNQILKNNFKSSAPANEINLETKPRAVVEKLINKLRSSLLLPDQASLTPAPRSCP